MYFRLAEITVQLPVPFAEVIKLRWFKLSLTCMTFKELGNDVITLAM